MTGRPITSVNHVIPIIPLHRSYRGTAIWSVTHYTTETHVCNQLYKVTSFVPLKILHDILHIFFVIIFSNRHFNDCIMEIQKNKSKNTGKDKRVWTNLWNHTTRKQYLNVWRVHCTLLIFATVCPAFPFLFCQNGNREEKFESISTNVHFPPRFTR